MNSSNLFTKQKVSIFLLCIFAFFKTYFHKRTDFKNVIHNESFAKSVFS